MSKISVKKLSAVLAVLLLASLLLAGAGAAGESCGDGVEYTLTGTELNITFTGTPGTNTGAMTNYNDTGPWGTGITKVTIGNNVTSIGECAFLTCSSMTSVEIPNTLTSIGEFAFSGCSSLTSDIIIPDNVTTIGENAFSYCSSLSSATIGSGVISMGENVFGMCTSLHAILFEGSEPTLGTSISPAATVWYTKSKWTGANVGITNAVTNGATIKSTFNPTDNTTLPLASEMENGTKTFGGWYLYADFSGSSVTQITSGSTVYAKWIESGIIDFGTCGDNLTWVLTDDYTLTISGTGAMTNWDDKDSVPWYSYSSSITSVVIQNGATSIGDYAFEDCTSMTTVTIPDTVTSIGLKAFTLSTSLTSVTIPDSVETIGGYAFNSCSKLTTITIPDSVTSIGNYAFAFCTSLTSINVDSNNQNYSSKDGVLYDKGKTLLILCPAGKSGDHTIPDTVTSIDEYAFSNCAKLTSITVDENNQYYSSKDGVLFNKSGSKLIRCPAGKSGEYNIPNDVTSIENHAFNSCAKLISITIPETVTSIGAAAFENCTGLTEITIPSNVTSIGDFAFSGCSGLTSVTIPGNVTSIGICAFDCCTKLTSINVDGNNQNYSSKDGVLFNKNKTLLIQCPAGKSGNYIIPDTVTSIGWYSFICCAGLTSVTIPDTVTYIEEAAFENCTGLTSVTIPSNVTSIEMLVFYGCTGLTSVTIPDTVTSIGTKAFAGCTNLKRINLTGIFETVPSIDTTAFDSCYGPIYIVSSGLQPYGLIYNFTHAIILGTGYVPVCYITNVDESQLESIEYYVVDLKDGVLAGNYVQSYNSDNKPVLPTSSNISKTGYTFDGWYKDAALTEKFDESAVLTQQNNKAYAKWTENSKPATRSSSTSFSGSSVTKSGNVFTFDTAVVATKAVLPGATSASITNISGNGWYNFDLTAPGFTGNGVLYFQVPLDVLEVKGFTTDDVGLYHYENGSWELKPTTFLKKDNQYAYYSATFDSCSPFMVDFEEGATATTAVEKVQEVVEQKKETVEQKQETAEKVQDVVEQIQTEVEEKQTAAKSPFPVLGILAGLGIAGLVALRRRH